MSRSPTPFWSFVRSRLFLYLASVALQLVLAPIWVHDWDGFVFVRSVDDFLAGRTPYAVAEQDPLYIHISQTWPPANMWFAYPPLPLLLMTPGVWAAQALGGAPWMIRLGFKLLFIPALPVLAWAGGRLLEDLGQRAAVRGWESAVLLNPYLIFVTAVWGMFDVWMMALVVLSIWLLHGRKLCLAGLALGGAVLCKIFPLFVVPLLLIYVWRRSGKGVVGALAFAGALTAAVVTVCLPFAVSHLDGFLNQVWRMHGARPPQGLSIFAVVFSLGRYLAVTGHPGWQPSDRGIVAALPLAFTAAFVLVSLIGSLRARGTRHLLHHVLLTLLGVMLASKVLNEQYFVMPVALLLLLAAATGEAWYARGAWLHATGALVAGLVLGWHVFTFWPDDVTRVLFGRNSQELAVAFRVSLGVRPETFAFAAEALAFLAVVPAMLHGFDGLEQSILQTTRVLDRVLRRRLGNLAMPAAGLLIATVLLGPPLGTWLTHRPTPRVERDARASVADPRIGTLYYLWWANTDFEGRQPAGNWARGVTQTPRDGFYSMTAAKLLKDFRQMRDSGIDFVAFSYHPYEEQLLPAVIGAAERAGLRVAPLVELSDVLADPENQPLDIRGQPLGSNHGWTITHNTQREFVRRGLKAIEAVAASQVALLIDGRPAVFLYDSYFGSPDSRPEATSAFETHAARLATGPEAPRWQEAYKELLQQPFPRTEEELIARGPAQALARRAYVERYREFWREVRARLERHAGPLFLVGGETWEPGARFYHGTGIAVEGIATYDASFIYSPSFVWVGNRRRSFERNWGEWADRETIAAQYYHGADKPVFVTVTPAYDDRASRKDRGFAIPADTPEGSTFDRGWKLAQELDADYVLLSTWNEFYEGSGIEPSREYGTRFVDAVTDWSQRLRAHRPHAHKVLLVTSETPSHYTAAGSPDWTLVLSHELQLLLRDVLPTARIRAVDANARHLGKALRDDLDLVLVEPGAHDWLRDHDGLLARSLESWVAAGGHALVFGADVGDRLANLWGAEEVSVITGPVEAVTAESVYSFRRNDRTRLVSAPPDAMVHVWLSGEDGLSPGAWSMRRGRGLVVGTAFRPALAADRSGGGKQARLLCEVLRPLLEDLPPDRRLECRSAQ